MSGGLPAEVCAAVAAGRLAPLPAALVARLLSGAVTLDVPAGTVVHHAGSGPLAQLLVRGVLRSVITSAEGRRVTIRYSRPGALLGIASVFSTGDAVDVQALTDVQLLALSVPVVQHLARTEVLVAHALLAEVSDRVCAYMEAVGHTTFASVRARLVRCLLDVAAEGRPGGPLVAPLSQQELAEHAGTVREVAVRVLRDLRDEGLVRTERGRVVLCDPDRLAAQTWAPAP
ncbi:Crp/Fnr family transcriptional regulator [Streptomyces sp. NPDC049541]|uniref:Crp/Fnr family transcriptional regulator n=1 Tax=Streptomyces sp. NPDC049541 TaxID=3365594 RepID=UPI0037B97DB0